MGVPQKSSPPQKSYARHFQVGDTLIDLVMYPSECVQLAQLWSFVLEPMKVVVCLQDWVFKIGSNIIEGVLTLVASYGIMVQLYASSLQHKAMLKIMCSKIHVKILKELCWSHYLDKSEGDWSKPGRHVPESWNNQERKLSSFSIDGDTVLRQKTQVWFGKHQLAPSRSAMIRCHQVRFWWWLTFDADSEWQPVDQHWEVPGNLFWLQYMYMFFMEVIYSPTGWILKRFNITTISRFEPPLGMKLSSPVGKVWRMKASKIARKC